MVTTWLWGERRPLTCQVEFRATGVYFRRVHRKGMSLTASSSWPPPSRPTVQTQHQSATSTHIRRSRCSSSLCEPFGAKRACLGTAWVSGMWWRMLMFVGSYCAQSAFLPQIRGLMLQLTFFFVLSSLILNAVFWEILCRSTNYQRMFKLHSDIQRPFSVISSSVMWFPEFADMFCAFCEDNLSLWFLKKKHKYTYRMAEHGTKHVGWRTVLQFISVVRSRMTS